MISLRTLLATTATLSLAGLAVAVAGPAAAQDMEDNWSGFYVGANLGASWADTSTRLQATTPSGVTIIPPADLARINTLSDDDKNETDFTGGLEAGYNYVTGNFLLGLETDFGFLNINERRNRTFTSAVAGANPPTFNIDQRVKTDWMWTLRPRVGYAGSNWMVYGTGGLAMTKIKYTASYVDTRLPPNNVNIDESDTKTGWVLGLGGAYAINPQWSVKGEYLYASFGHVNGSSPTGVISLDSRERVKANILRMGVDYRF